MVHGSNIDGNLVRVVAIEDSNFKIVDDSMHITMFLIRFIKLNSNLSNK